MKKAIGTAALSLSFVAGALIAGQVRDRHDLEEVHKHIIESIHEMERARAANDHP